MTEPLFVCFEYDALEVDDGDLRRIMMQIKASLVPSPERVYVAMGPAADELRRAIVVQSGAYTEAGQ